MEKAKYDPEDIESLLANKTFGELYPEEKEFVLRHLDNETEYLRMRETLFGIKKVSEDDVLISPGDKTKETLMDLFESKHRKRPFLIWLNSIFLTIKNQAIALFAQPRFAYSLATVCVALIGWFIWDGFQEEKVRYAEHQTEEIKMPEKDLEMSNDKSAILSQESKSNVNDASQAVSANSNLNEEDEVIGNTESNNTTDNLAIVENEAVGEEVDLVAKDNVVESAVPPLGVEESPAEFDSDLAEIIVEDVKEDTRNLGAESTSDLNKAPATAESLERELDVTDNNLTRNEEAELADEIAPGQIEEVTIVTQSKSVNRIQIMSSRRDKIIDHKEVISLSRSAKADFDLIDLLFTAL